LQDGEFADTVIDAIIDKTNTEASDGRRWSHGSDVIRYIYDNTLDSSKARQLLVDIEAHQVSGGEWLAKHADLPKAFLHSLAVVLLDIRSGMDKPEGLSGQSITCRYHQHGPDLTLCYKHRLKNRMGWN
jgi:hypothetical protein